MNKVSDTYGIKIPSDPFVYGDLVYFTLNWIEDDEYISSVYSYDGKDVTRITFGGHEKKPSVRDGKLYYVSYGKEEESLTVLEGMKEPRTLYSNRAISKYVFHNDDILVITQDHFDRDKPVVTSKLKYRYDTSGFLRTRMKLVLLETPPRDLVSGDFDVVDISSNGKRIIFSATIEDDDRGSEDVYELSLEKGEYKRLTAGTGEADRVLVTADGRALYTGHRDGKKPWVSSRLIYHDEGKEARIGNGAENTVGSDLFVSGENSLVENDGSIYLIGQENGVSSVYSVSSGNVRKLTGERISVRSFHASNGKLAYIYTSHRHPSILHFENEYDPNPKVEGTDAEHFTVDGKDAWLMLSSRDAPTVLAIHGGPQTAYGYAFSIEFNFLHDRGFNVLFGNPRGSDSYGDEFAEGCIGDWGGKDLEDVLAFADHAIKEFGLKDNFAITGGSYGGYMTNAAIVKTDRFKCAVSERCVSNLMSMCGTSDIGFWFNAVESEVEDPWSEEGMKKLLAMSPITGAKKVRTPTMFIHGEEDYRCPIEQSEQMYTAIRINGVDSVLARYQGDSHEHARRGDPRNMKDRLDRKLSWFSNYLIG